MANCSRTKNEKFLHAQSETGTFHSAYSSNKSWILRLKIYVKMVSQKKIRSVFAGVHIRETMWYPG